MKNCLILIFLIVALSNSFYAQIANNTLSTSKENSQPDKRFAHVLQFGNIHGIGVEVNFKIIDEILLNSSFGIKPPLEIIWGPPFPSNRLNLTIGTKFKPQNWLYIDVGFYFGLYKLTEYLWITKPKASIGFEITSIVLEIGAAFNIPTKIYTSSEISGGSVGYGEERIKPSSPTFPFFKIGYKVIL